MQKPILLNVSFDHRWPPPPPWTATVPGQTSTTASGCVRLRCRRCRRRRCRRRRRHCLPVTTTNVRRRLGDDRQRRNIVLASFVPVTGLPTVIRRRRRRRPSGICWNGCFADATTDRPPRGTRNGWPFPCSKTVPWRWDRCRPRNHHTTSSRTGRGIVFYSIWNTGPTRHVRDVFLPTTATRRRTVLGFLTRHVCSCFTPETHTAHGVVRPGR